MFFRRKVERALTFSERLQKLADAGFRVEKDGESRARVSRGDCAAIVADGDGVADSGPLMGGEIGKLVDLGYQKIYEAPGGRRVPARAGQLEAMHTFLEDLREGLGLTSLYNESLGTVNTSHQYDRVEHREEGPFTPPWRHKP